MKNSRYLVATVGLLSLLFISYIGYDEYYHWDRKGRSLYKYDDYLKSTKYKTQPATDFSLPKSMIGLYEIISVDEIIRNRWGKGPLGYSDLVDTETDFNITIRSGGFRFYKNFCRIKKGQLIKEVSTNDVYYIIAECSATPQGQSGERTFFIETVGSYEGKNNVIVIHEEGYRPWYTYQTKKIDGLTTNWRQVKRYISAHDFQKEIEDKEKNQTSKEVFNYKWEHSVIKDPMTDKTIINSTLFDETKSSWLGFMCEQNGTSVFTVKVAPASNRNYEFGTHEWDAKVDIRFDEEQMSTEKWTLDLRYGVLPVSKNFIENMMGKTKVALRIKIPGDESTFIYNINGFESHYKKYISSCPLSNR